MDGAHKCKKILNFQFFHSFFGSIFSYPFNWRTPIGYLIALLSQCGSSFVTLYNICPIICFLVGTCWALIGCCVDISNELPHLNTIEAPRGKGCSELKARICSVARMLAGVKQFSDSNRVTHHFHMLDFLPHFFSALSTSLTSSMNSIVWSIFPGVYCRFHAHC